MWGDDRPFILKWSPTWPDTPDVKQDFTGKDANRPVMYARVYRSPAGAHPGKSWFWTVFATHQIDSGHERTTSAAARKAEEAYLAWRDKQ